MLTIIRPKPSSINTEAQAFFAEETRLSAFTPVIGLVAALDAACVIIALLAA